MLDYESSILKEDKYHFYPLTAENNRFSFHLLSMKLCASIHTLLVAHFTIKGFLNMK